MWCDLWWTAGAALLAVWILLSGLDDLFVDLVYFLRRPKPALYPAQQELAQAPQRRIAIFVPLWREHAVIEQMLRHNLSAILYANYDVFVGVYPNDPLTSEAVNRVARDDARVHITVCPHDGPTSKGDCLNAIYEGMAEYERQHGVAFEILISHDAEDRVHPESLHLVNWFSRDYPMVQIPVLPLPTALSAWIHGLYCDEFAEFQCKDIPVRQALGGFLPANGVGTGFQRSAAETLRRLHDNKLFDPDCLTEDYETGFRMYSAGYRQLFVPLHAGGNGLVATREYFPKKWRDAIRQRKRWVLGIALQGWERHGWGVSPRQVYWFWRDRKGLAGNLIAPLANLMCLGWLATRLMPWAPTRGSIHFPPWLAHLFVPAACLALIQISIRYCLSARIYGAVFAAGSLVRTLLGNLINCTATVAALGQFAVARIRSRPLAWDKTNHDYDDYDAVPVPSLQRPLLGDVLLRLRVISSDDLQEALLHKARGQRTGEYLIQMKKITASHLDQALASQSACWLMHT